MSHFHVEHLSTGHKYFKQKRTKTNITNHTLTPTRLQPQPCPKNSKQNPKPDPNMLSYTSNISLIYPPNRTKHESKL